MIHVDIKKLRECKVDPEVIHCIEQLSRLNGAPAYEQQLNELVESLIRNDKNQNEKVLGLYAAIHGSNKIALALKWFASKLVITIAMILSIPLSLLYAPVFIVTAVVEQISLNAASRKAKKEGKKARGLFDGVLYSIPYAVFASLGCTLIYASQVTRLFKSKGYALQQFLTGRLKFLSEKDKLRNDSSLRTREETLAYLKDFRTLPDSSGGTEALNLEEEYTIELLAHTIHASWLSGVRPLKGHLGNHAQSVIRVTQDGKAFYKYYNSQEQAMDLYTSDYTRFVEKPGVLDFGTPTKLDASTLRKILAEIQEYNKQVSIKMNIEGLGTLLSDHSHYQKRYDMRYFPTVLFPNKSAEKKAALQGRNALCEFLNKKGIKKTDQEIDAMHLGHNFITPEYMPGGFDCTYYLSLLAAPHMVKVVKSQEFGGKIMRAGKGMKKGPLNGPLGVALRGVARTPEEANDSSFLDKCCHMWGC
jgi:hypothetical protein